MRSMRPSGLMARHSDSVTVPGSSIRRASAVPNNAASGTPPRPSIRRASAAPSVGGAPRPSISRRCAPDHEHHCCKHHRRWCSLLVARSYLHPTCDERPEASPDTDPFCCNAGASLLQPHDCTTFALRRSVGSGSTLVGRPSVSRMSGLGGQRPAAADAGEAAAEEERPRLRWRRNLDSVSDAPPVRSLTMSFNLLSAHCSHPTSSGTWSARLLMRPDVSAGGS